MFDSGIEKVPPLAQVPRSCGVLIVCGDPIQSFLLMKHADRWDLPKGHVDPGETDLECALREMHEETGISPDLVTVETAFHYSQQYEVPAVRYGGKKSETALKTLVIFLARVDKEYEIQVTEHLDAKWFRWVPHQEIQTRAIDPLLRALEKYLGIQKTNSSD
ncbi:bis(5'-nucleosyl)-tetraphosphatase [Planctomicrobium sp. SH668]|uniref:bis(5'-nucleosyl)-tetraphosphatase n=1 Tax=Planctomicrobium sp. SH668 TaxID=3448126 RepID=UPI003F5C3131